MSNQNTSIYVIGPEKGPFKIGFAACPKKRLSSLQTGTTESLRIHYSQETETPKAKIIEKLIHRQIAHKRIRGEWFNIPLEQAIDEVKYAFIRWDSEDHLELLAKHKKL